MWTASLTFASSLAQVRANLRVVAAVVRRLPEANRRRLRILHLYRDPRASAFSVRRQLYAITRNRSVTFPQWVGQFCTSLVRDDYALADELQRNMTNAKYLGEHKKLFLEEVTSFTSSKITCGRKFSPNFSSEILVRNIAAFHTAAAVSKSDSQYRRVQYERLIADGPERMQRFQELLRFARLPSSAELLADFERVHFNVTSRSYSRLKRLTGEPFSTIRAAGFDPQHWRRNRDWIDSADGRATEAACREAVHLYKEQSTERGRFSSLLG